MYKSEVHIPVHRDSLSFQDRQSQKTSQWSNVEERMEERRKQWQVDLEKMRQEMLVLRPSEKEHHHQQQQQQTCLSLPPALDSIFKSMFETDSDGRQVFRVRFEVSEFQPEEVTVKVQENRVCVKARHEEKTPQTSVSKEYSRQVDIPTGVDQDKLSCTLTKDGVLTVEAPLLNPLPPLTPTTTPFTTTLLPVQNAPSPPSPSPSTTTTHISPSFSSPSVAFSSSSPSRLMSVATPVKNAFVTDPDGSRRMRLSVDVGDFRPEEVTVKTADRKLIVHAQHEEKTAGRTLHKELNKEYDLPESVDPSTISAFLGEDKQLTIEAPLKPQVQRKVYEVRQTQEVQRRVTNKESSVTISDPHHHSHPVVTISVHRK